ncbi:unnamed protein product [Sphagnum troendelagicum]|uniref:Uncharacterized protein n=1 Tax=Sphagnum troendelagicum TaxID=128251 RepID=A0ABP0TQP3_9BRYO
MESDRTSFFSGRLRPIVLGSGRMGVESDRLFLRASSSSSACAHTGGARRGSFLAAQFARSKEGFVGLLEQILKEFLLALHSLLVSFSRRAFTAEDLGLF